MRPPLGFDPREFQKRIDAVTGTRNGKPLIKLAWAPNELRWRPHPLGSDVLGYTFPIFFYGWDAEGKEIAAPRWVLLQRAESQHYAATWEQGRYSVYDGQVWDWKGPCPDERYTELRAHCYHDGTCCPCHGSECKCGEEYDHCWGQYVEPNERLLDWVRWTVSESLKDKDVDPNADIRYFSAPNAQRDVATASQHAVQKKKAEADEFGREMADFWARKPTTLRQSESGLYLLS